MVLLLNIVRYTDAYLSRFRQEIRKLEGIFEHHWLHANFSNSAAASGSCHNATTLGANLYLLALYGTGQCIAVSRDAKSRPCCDEANVVTALDDWICPKPFLSQNRTACQTPIKGLVLDGADVRDGPAIIFGQFRFLFREIITLQGLACLNAAIGDERQTVNTDVDRDINRPGCASNAAKPDGALAPQPRAGRKERLGARTRCQHQPRIDFPHLRLNPTRHTASLVIDEPMELVFNRIDSYIDWRSRKCRRVHQRRQRVCGMDARRHRRADCTEDEKSMKISHLIASYFGGCRRMHLRSARD